MKYAERQIVRRVLLGYTTPEKSLLKVAAESINELVTGTKPPKGFIGPETEFYAVIGEPDLKEMPLSTMFRLAYGHADHEKYRQLIAEIYELKVKKPADPEIVEAIFNCFHCPNFPQLLPKISRCLVKPAVTLENFLERDYLKVERAYNLNEDSLKIIFEKNYTRQGFLLVCNFMMLFPPQKDGSQTFPYLYRLLDLDEKN